MVATKIVVLVRTEWTPTEKGNYFEDLIKQLFIRMQFKVYSRLRFTGVEIDLLAEHTHTKEKALIECKFLQTSFEAGIIAKLIGNATLDERIDQAYLVTSSEPTKDAAGKILEIKQNNNKTRGGIRFGYIGPEELLELYLAVNNFPSWDIRKASLPDIDGISSVTLLIAPESPCWIIEKSRGGKPEKAIVVPVDPKLSQVKDFSALRELIDQNKLWIGLELVNGINTTLDNAQLTSRQEVITQVPMANEFDDYGPARPEDFVGRKKLLKDIEDHLIQLQDGQPKRRIIALSGPSGYGKSSVVLKLADDCRSNNKLKNNVYIYHVDSRSATSPLFVVEAVRNAFLQARNDKFIGVSEDNITIDSTEDVFSSDSIKACLSNLSENKRVLVIFFDQFEELLVKESLAGAFEAIRKLAFAIEVLEGSNFVLGFSWKTGIQMPESHPAYHLWHSLQDRRAEFKIHSFSSTEASELLSTIERRNFKNKLETSLKKHLLEQSQGLPWLLKKFCVHIYHKLESNVSQKQLLSSQLDAKSLFKEDTDPLDTKQLKCLKYIAEHSPVDLWEVEDLYGKDVPEFLYNSRLIIKSGTQYSVYWDIFKEYLITNKVPPTPLTFIPQAQLKTDLKVLKFLDKDQELSVDQIEKAFGHTTRSTQNIITDLATFFLIKRVAPGYVKIAEELRHSSKREDFQVLVASALAEQLKRHTIFQKIDTVVRPGNYISSPELEKLISDSYSTTKPKTLHTYIMRLLPWLEFAGLIEMTGSNQILRPIGEGSEKGKLPDVEFFCRSTPKRVVDLAVYLYKVKAVPRKNLDDPNSLKAAQDLITLDLAYWNNDVLTPEKTLADVIYFSDVQLKKDCTKIIKDLALASKFLTLLSELLSQEKTYDEKNIAASLKKEFRKNWQDSYAQKYIAAGKQWLETFNSLRTINGQSTMVSIWSDDNYGI